MSPLFNPPGPTADQIADRVREELQRQMHPTALAVKALEENRQHALAEEIIVGPWFTPRAPGAAGVPNIAATYTSYAQEDIEASLEGLNRAGCLEVVDGVVEGYKLYRATKTGWLLGEDIRHRRGCRLPCLLRQRDHNPMELVLALAACPAIWNRRNTGGFLGSAPQVQIPHIEIYLFKYSPLEIEQAVAALVAADLMTRDGEQVTITLKGRREYATRVQEALRIRDGQSILDEVRISKIEVFWAWQSDYPNSRNQIDEALERLVEDSKAWALTVPLTIVVATRPGDGATRIDQALLRRIDECTIFVGDITPVYRFDDMACPNPNVVFETGYALARKNEADVVLVQQKKQGRDVGGGADPKLPFDIASCRRLVYDGPKELRKMLIREVEARLRSRGLLQ